jgi:6-phosphogluconate dehydrogenase
MRIFVYFCSDKKYRMMKQGLGLSNEAMADVFAKWNNGPLNSYMIGDKIIVFQEP